MCPSSFCGLGRAGSRGGEHLSGTSRKLCRASSRCGVHFYSSCSLCRSTSIGGVRESRANGEHRRASANGACRTCYSCGVHLSGDSAELRSTRSSAVCNSSEPAAPVQYDAPTMTATGVDLNRDGMSDVLQQPQVGIVCPTRSTCPVWRTTELRTRAQNTWTVTGTDMILLVISYEKVVRTLWCPLSALMRWGQGRCAALPRGLCDRGRETRGLS